MVSFGVEKKMGDADVAYSYLHNTSPSPEKNTQTVHIFSYDPF